MCATGLLRLLFALLLSVPLLAAAQPFMVYGAHDGYPKYYEEDGQAKGIVVEITRHCLDEMQLPYQIRLLPWMRAYTLAERGGGGVIGLSRSQEREALFDFSEPIFTERIVVLVKQGREFSYQGIEDLRDRLVGTSIGASYGTAFDQAVADGSLTIVGFNDVRNGLAMLQRERIDAILLGSSVDVARLAQGSRNLQGAQFSTLPVPFKTDSKYLGIAKSLKMGWFLQRFNQCLAQGHASGLFEPVIYRYSN
jgi:polar amino acid transport system substrate-binding protein